MNRRRFLQSGFAAAGAAALGLDRLQGGLTSPVFPCGVASGDPRANSIVLWTKVDPEPLLGSPSAVRVGYDVAPSPLFRSFETRTGLTIASSGRDFTVKAAIREFGLQPFTDYYYRFRVEGFTSPVGRFRTLPDPGQTIPRLRLAFMSCQDYTNGYYNALADLLDQDIDYVIHLGDYIYESTGDPSFQGQQIRPIGLLPSGETVAQNLEDYRFLYKTYRSDPRLQLAHQLHPFIQVWDDHEFQNDSWKSRHPDNTDTPGAPEPELRQEANKAWSEYIPANTPFDPDADPLESLRIYRAFRFGALAQLVMTDQRLYRDGLPCGLDDRFFTPGCPELEAPDRTMLGVEQRDWFLGKMADSTSIWNIWGTEVMAMALKLGFEDPVIKLSLDQWDGFPAERAALLTALGDVPNVVAVTGDIHSFGAGYLKPDFLDRRSPRTAVEFVGGSVTSSNFGELLGSDGSRVSDPMPRSAAQAAFPDGILEAIVRLTNPHFQFFNSTTHGYGILDITPERAVCEFRSVDGITTPNATASTLARFTVPRDVVALIRG